MFIAELALPDFAGYDLSSLRTGMMAGSPCPVEVMKRVVSEMGMTEVTICYGMTETSPVSTLTGADDDLERYGEELMAWVRLREGAEPLTAEALRSFCAGRLAHYKVPRYVKVVDEFPMTVTGKIRKGGDAAGLGRGARTAVGGRGPQRLSADPGRPVRQAHRGRRARGGPTAAAAPPAPARSPGARRGRGRGRAAGGGSPPGTSPPWRSAPDR